jgi:hypothetical protein
MSYSQVKQSDGKILPLVWDDLVSLYVRFINLNWSLLRQTTVIAREILSNQHRLYVICVMFSNISGEGH